MAQECIIERYTREFLYAYKHGRKFQNRQKSLLAWCTIYCSLNNLEWIEKRIDAKPVKMCNIEIRDPCVANYIYN